MNRNTKTVYFLGAGFSADAGGPIQNQIIKTLTSDDFAEKQGDDDVEILNKFKEYLSEELCISKDKYNYVELEDVFTPIDRCLIDGKSLGCYSHKDLTKLREDFHYLMAKAIQYGVDVKGGNDSEYIKQFAQKINTKAKGRLKNVNKDEVAIITTNWDILLDNRLHEIVRQESDSMCSDMGVKQSPLAVVDYCCYISSIDENDEYVKPGLLALGRGGYNIKYLKLHGSMNWLHCPMCQRMYVKFYEKIVLGRGYCRHCQNNFDYQNIDAVKLSGNLILPTFLKNLNNIQIQLVWQNAAIELSEASRIVFIGYSLPSADFEIRQLLSRFVRKNTEIDVVIYPGSKSNEDLKRIDEEIDRYNIFFGNRKITPILEKVPDYVKTL